MALLEHLPPRRARDQPGLRHVGIHDVEKVFRLLVDDLGDLVPSGGDDENINASEAADRPSDDRVAICFRARALGDGLDFPAELFAFGCDFFQLGSIIGAEHDIGARSREHLRRKRAKGAGRASDDRGLAANLEQGKRILQEVLGHGSLAYDKRVPVVIAGHSASKTRANALMPRNRSCSQEDGCMGQARA